MRRFFTFSCNGRISLALCAVPAFFLCLSSVSQAQTSLSTIRGTVTDSSGSVIPGVAVTADETSTNEQARSVKTDANGNYEMPDLKLGTYRIRASLTGFKTFVAENINLSSNQTLRVDAMLTVGDAATEITVSGAAPVIETEEGKISSDYRAEQYRNAPLPGNAYSSPLPVLATMPNVQSNENSYNVSFAGQTGAQLDMGMDGVKEETLNTQTVNMESVEEVKVVVVNNSAEFSRVGYYNVVTKRGSNQFHGEASYYHRNSALGARGFFEPQKAHVIYHTFNGSVSGPVIKNRTFFYALWNGERVPGGGFHLDTVPTSAFRGGDFSQLLTLASPVKIKDPLTGTPFPGNVIPADRLNATSLKAQNAYLPSPNLGAANSLANNFGFTWPYPDDQFHADVLTTRVDHRFSDKNSLYGRFSAYLPRYILAGNYPDTFWTRLRQSYSWAIVDTHVFTPNLVNTFTFGGNRDRVSDGDPIGKYTPLHGNDVVSSLGITGVNSAGLSAMGFPVMSITGYPALSVQPGGITTDTRNFSGVDSVSWAFGRHILKAGGEIRTFRNFNGKVPSGAYGNFTFNGSLTGNAYADFLLGLPYSSQRLTPLTNRVSHAQEMGYYVTDTFKVTSNLTLDFGLRWDYFFSPTYADGLEYNWDPSTGNVVVPQAAMSKVSALYPSTIKIVAGQVAPNPSRTNFAPRVSAAYRLDNKTVLRGGYGIFTETLGPFALLQSGGPFQIGETFFNNGSTLFSFPNPFPAGTGQVPAQSISGYPLNTTNGRIQQFNVTLERQIKDIGIRLSYVGSRNRGMNYGLGSFNLGSLTSGAIPSTLELDKPQPSLIPFTNARRPYPQFVSTTYDRRNGESNYNALSLEVRRRVGQVSFDGSWTWATNMANYLNLENPYAPLSWNRDANPEHRVAVNAVWNLPVGKNKPYLANANRFADAVLGGWQLYWTGFFQTGHYFTPTYSGSDSSNTNTFGGLPNRIANGNYSTGNRALNNWFDASAFTIPVAGSYGNSGVNILEGPGLNVQNLALSKHFRITERINFSLQGMASNLLNHPNFTSPPSNISVPGQVGVIGSQSGFFSVEKSGPRMIELRVRVDF